MSSTCKSNREESRGNKLTTFLTAEERCVCPWLVPRDQALHLVSNLGTQFLQSATFCAKEIVKVSIILCVCGWVSAQGPANKYISLRDRRSRREDTIFEPKCSIRLFRYYIKFLNKENMHTYSYGVLLYSEGRIPPLVTLFADLYQFCTKYVLGTS